METYQRREPMKRIVGVMAVIAVLALALAPAALAQGGPKWRGSGGWGPGSQHGRLYDPKTVETVSGEVVKVERITPMHGMSGGMYLTVKTDKEEVPVHLGPLWYLENQDVKIAPKDKVEIKGSRVTVQEKPAIIAAEVKKGDQTLKLRDEAGVPVWSGWRRG
jgi:hypothetical protein